MNNPEEKLKKLLYKPLLIKHLEDNIQSLIIFYSYECVQSNEINSYGQEEITYEYILHVINVTDSVEKEEIISNIVSMQNIDSLMKSIIIPEEGQFIDQITKLTNMVAREASELNEAIIRTTKAFNVLNKIMRKNSLNNNEDSNLIINTPDGGLAHIVYNAIGGKNKQLNKEDIEKIGSIIHEVMTRYISTDLDNADNAKKLKHEIEYKIIECLPPNIKSNDINLNMDYIINEIKSLQEEDDIDA